MLSKPEDLAPLLLLVAVLLTQIAVFVLVQSLWLTALAAVLLLPLQGSLSAVNHNHHHRNMFRAGWANRLLEVGMYLETGVSPYAWTLHHVIGHHRYYLDPAKDTSPWLDRQGRVMGRWRYCFRNALMIYPECVRIGRSYPGVLRKFVWMFIASNLLLGLLLWLDPAKTLILFVLPMLGMLLFLVDTTFEHHVGLDTEDEMAATNTRLDWFYNVCSWNLGYHTAHHVRPGLHWTELPAFHQTIEHRIPSARIARSWWLSELLRGRRPRVAA